MPFYKKISDNNFEIALWKIEEDPEYFQLRFNAHPEIKNEKKRLQWYASRYLVNTLLGEKVSFMKDADGKPFLKNNAHHLSLSHTAGFAAVIVSEKFKVGIDLEAVHPKVERIAHKFLREDEINSIHAKEKIRKLILYWSAKESLYKFHNNIGIDFTTQLLIDPFEMKERGEMIAEISVPDFPLKNLKVQYEFFENHVLTYVVGR